MHVAGCTPISILYVVNVGSKGCRRETAWRTKALGERLNGAKGKDWRNSLGPRCYGCGKGCPLWVDDKRALLHYVRNTMSEMKQATQWLLWCENEIKVHLYNKQLIPLGVVYELEHARDSLLEPCEKLQHLVHNDMPLVMARYDHMFEDHRFTGIPNQKMFDYLQVCLQQVGAEFLVGYTVTDMELYENMRNGYDRFLPRFLNPDAIRCWLHPMCEDDRTAWPEEVEREASQRYAVTAERPFFTEPVLHSFFNNSWDGDTTADLPENPPTPLVEPSEWTPTPEAVTGALDLTMEIWHWRDMGPSSHTAEEHEPGYYVTVPPLPGFGESIPDPPQVPSLPALGESIPERRDPPPPP